MSTVAAVSPRAVSIWVLYWYWHTIHEGRYCKLVLQLASTTYHERRYCKVSKVDGCVYEYCTVVTYCESILQLAVGLYEYCIDRSATYNESRYWVSTASGCVYTSTVLILEFYIQWVQLLQMSTVGGCEYMSTILILAHYLTWGEVMWDQYYGFLWVYKHYNDYPMVEKTIWEIKICSSHCDSHLCSHCVFYQYPGNLHDIWHLTWIWLIDSNSYI